MELIPFIIVASWTLLGAVYVYAMRNIEHGPILALVTFFALSPIAAALFIVVALLTKPLWN